MRFAIVDDLAFCRDEIKKIFSDISEKILQVNTLRLMNLTAENYFWRIFLRKHMI